MNRLRRVVWCGLLVAGGLLAGAGGSTVRADDWPQFRGPTGQGISRETVAPLTWGPEEHIRWKSDLPGLGWSSPAIAAGKVWLTTAVDDGKSLRVLCVDQESGKLLHDVEVFKQDDPGPIHSKNSHASPTPWIDGDRVYVHFGAHGTACVSTAGKVLWTAKLEHDHRHGPSGSPVVYKNLVILNCDGSDMQFVAALDKTTGKMVWRQMRDGAMAYSTPLVITVGGKDQLVSAGGEWVIAYEPLTGKEIWKVRYPKGYSNVPRPVYGQGLVFVSSGYNNPVLYAIDPDGTGDITDTHVPWMMKKGAPLNPSPIVVGEELYVCNDKGIASCLDAKTGKVHWQERINGSYSSSFVLVAGRLYIQNEDGLTTVLKPGRTFEVLAENQLPGRTLATLSPSDGALYLRTDAALYRIQD